MSKVPVTIADYFNLQVEWSDDSSYGASLSFRVQKLVREVLYPRATSALITSIESDKTITASFMRELILLDRQTQEHQDIISRKEFWYPEAERVKPSRLRITSTLGAGQAIINLEQISIQQIRNLLRGDKLESYWLFDNLYKTSIERFKGQKLDRLNMIKQSWTTHPLFIGHACISWSDGETRLWSDPFLRPKSPSYPLKYQPLGIMDFNEKKQVVMLTHTHADHFDPGTLLLFPAETTFLIPRIDRESLLSVDLDYRLRQLGFTNIHTLSWNEMYEAEPFTIYALPFYGEQPLGWGGGYELKDYNIGNTYLVQSKGTSTSNPHSSLLLADSGSDPRYTLQQFAHDIKKNYGEIDYLFCNHRRWRLYPSQYLSSSVPQYICYVPDSELLIRQKLMMDPETLNAMAEIIKAKYVIPYAMGGARWFEEIGLGVDYLKPLTQTSEFDAHHSELLNQQADLRFYLKEPFQLSLMLPGQWIDTQGEISFPGDLQLVTPEQFNAIKTVDFLNLVIEGESFSLELLSDLIEMTTLDEGSFLIVAPGFCEVYSNNTEQGGYLRQLLVKLIDETGLSYLQLNEAVSAKPFSQKKQWLKLFESTHRGLFMMLREGGDIVESVRLLLYMPIYSNLSKILLTNIVNTYLGLDLAITKNMSNADEKKHKGTFQEMGLPDLDLPDLASEYVLDYGCVQTSLAFLVVKVIHNNFLFCAEMNCFEDSTTEQVWFEAILGNK